MKPTTIEELGEIIAAQPRIAPFGRGSKTALAYRGEDAIPISSAGLSGILEYQPEEFVFTALAGTPVAEVECILAEQGQYLPFDPVLVEAGATLGGTVAAGLSGAGRYRYGGVRDSLLGVRFFDGRGNLVRSGGKVVKNAAGFDLPKFMVGSLGGYGFLVELSFKVMPKPPATATVQIEYPTLKDGLEALVRLTQQPLEIFALDLDVKNQKVHLLAQMGGAAATIPSRIERLLGVLGAPDFDTLQGDAESRLWREAREFAWVPSGSLLVKVPLTPKRVPALDQELAQHGAVRRYCAGANLAWVAWRGSAQELDAALNRQELGGLVILGEADKVLLGRRNGDSFARRVKQALDPQEKFVSPAF